jgi:prepilin-type N-terminal cleavage/methylation domain-containing protein
MNRSTPSSRSRAFTLIEVVVVTVVIAILVVIFLPALARSKARASRTSCTNCEKQIGLAFRIFANDNDDKFPWDVSTNEGGSREFRGVPFSAFQHFRVMSNELSTPRVVVCPDDRDRTPATNWAVAHDNSTLSYFAGLDATETNPASFLSGDRVLGSTRAPTNGLLTLVPSSSLWWKNSPHGVGGNLVMGDGSVQQLTSRSLLQLLRTNGLATNRLALPLIGP